MNDATCHVLVGRELLSRHNAYLVEIVEEVDRYGDSRPAREIGRSRGINRKGQGQRGVVLGEAAAKHVRGCRRQDLRADDLRVFSRDAVDRNLR